MNNENVINTSNGISDTWGLKYNVYVVIKRIVDIIGSIFGMVILFPLTIFVKITYMISGDFNSIFFTQERIGKDGKSFKLLKFRTMVMHADELLEQLMKKNKKIEKE